MLVKFRIASGLNLSLGLNRIQQERGYKIMEAKRKLRLLQRLLETRDDSILAIPIKVAGEDGFVIGVKHETKSAVLPLAFVLPDEVGQMFMDSDVFGDTPIEELDEDGEGEDDAPSKPTEGASGASDSGESEVVAFMLGPNGMQPMRLPDEIGAMLNSLSENFARLEKLRGVNKPRVQQPSKDEKGGVN